MLGISKINPMLRAVGTMGAIAATVGVVTLAAQTTNTVALTGNELDVTNDVLRISNGGAFGTTATGFSSSNLTLGNEGPHKAFYLQNLANANLAISASIPSGTVASTGLDLTKVHVNFYDEAGNAIGGSPTFLALESGPVVINGLNANAQGNSAVPLTEGNYSYSISTETTAVLSNPATVSTFELDFTGSST